LIEDVYNKTMGLKIKMQKFKSENSTVLFSLKKKEAVSLMDELYYMCISTK